MVSELPDPNLKGEFEEEELQVMAYLAKECLLLDPDSRPTMSEVVQILSTIAPETSNRKHFSRDDFKVYELTYFGFLLPMAMTCFLFSILCLHICLTDLLIPQTEKHIRSVLEETSSSRHVRNAIYLSSFMKCYECFNGSYPTLVQSLVFKWKKVKGQAHYLPSFKQYATGPRGFLGYS